jgi:glycosyltransferase involved in cell wall biosynthesis
LVIVGDGPDKNILIDLTVSLGLMQDVRFLGFQDNSLPYIKGFDLLVLPSTHEGIPTELMESLFVRTPAIATNVGGTPELSLYDELLFEPRNIDALIKKLLAVFHSEETYQMVKSLCDLRKTTLQFGRNEKVIRRVLEVIS